MNTQTKQSRKVERIIYGNHTADGDGVTLKRLIGSPALMNLDPFLLFDEFGANQAQDYIGGFPEHPHRGFQTVTYILEGQMRHQDSKGHSGLLSPGSVQWMNAGRGILHSEMPEQTAGRLRGFQLWVNLPAAQKMSEPAYQEFTPEQIPTALLGDGVTARIIAGTTEQGIAGAVRNIVTEPLYFDVHLENVGGRFKHSLPEGHAAFIYAYAGTLELEGQLLSVGELGVLTDGDKVRASSLEQDTRFLLIAAKPLNEPIVQRGPFVMNTLAEIHMAQLDYKRGTLA